MAGEKGIRRVVQLALDKAQTLRVKRDLKKTLDDGTDSRTATRNLSRVERGLQGLRRTAINLAGAFALAFGVRRIIDFAKETVRAAATEDAIWNRLRGTVQSAGADFDELNPKIQATARALQDISTVGDDDFAATMSTLVAISGDVEASLNNVVVVADLAGTGLVNLETAATLVGRAMVGETTLFKRYGIELGDTGDAVEVLRERFAGLAENEGKSLEGLMIRLNNEWGDFKEAVGFALTEASGATPILERLIGVVFRMTKAVERNQSTFDAAASVFTWVGKVLGFMYNSFRAVIRIITGGLTVAVGAVIRGFGGLATALLAVVEVGAKFAELFGAEAAAEGLQSFADKIQGLTDKANALGDAMIRVGAQQITGGLPGTPTAPVREVGAGTGVSGVGTGTGTGGRQDLARNLELEFVPMVKTLDEIEAKALRLPEIMREVSQEMQLGMVSAAFAIQQAFEEGFTAIATGAKSLPEAFAGIGAGIIAGLSEGMAQYHTAQGIGKIAEGTWPPNPAAIASALKHFAAAAAFKALGAVISNAATPSSGGAQAGGSNVGDAQSFGGNTRRTEVNIFIDPIDPENPLHQKVVGRAVQGARERYGDDIPIAIHKGTR